MAEGVSGSACLVCFMTQEYQDSKNCALELKFVSSCAVCVRARVWVRVCFLFRVSRLHSRSRLRLVSVLAIELQATQTGVPVVPVMVDFPYLSEMLHLVQVAVVLAHLDLILVDLRVDPVVAVVVE